MMEFKSLLDSAELGHKLDKKHYAALVPPLREALILAQDNLMRSRGAAVAILMSGVAAAGKSEAVGQLLAWLDPRFIETNGLNDPTDEERERPPMWRYWRLLPAKGHISIFFGHWYSDIVEARSRGNLDDKAFEAALGRINRFERMLADEGVALVKFNLHISLERQRKRIRKLLKNPETRWRVTEEDQQSLDRYGAIRDAYGEVLALTNFGHSPWTVIEAEDERYRDITVAEKVLETLRERVAAASDAATGDADKATATALAPPQPKRDCVLSTLDLTRAISPRRYAKELEHWQGKLALQLRSNAFKRRSLVLAFEGADAAGKGGTIRRVAATMYPGRYRIVSIAKPTDEALARPFLWRFWRHIPAHGGVTIFDRSWYGRVLVERVEALTPPQDWQRAYGEINDFEHELTEAGCMVMKFWLAISEAEQLRRFKAREASPFKQFKITPEDWRNRSKWQAYEEAVTDMVANTGTAHAPWNLIEAEDKHYGRIAVLKKICEGLEEQGC